MTTTGKTEKRHMTLYRELVIGLLAALVAPGIARAQATETVVHFHTDAVGSVRMVTDANGQVLERHDYAPFGEPVQVGTQTSRFAGSERDAESELGYFGARHYRPLTGRFTTVDPLLDPAQALVQPRRWNRYAYSLNNSLAFVDPDGRDPTAVVTRLVQSPPVQRLINHPITQRLLASSGISSGNALFQRLNNRLFNLSVRLFNTPAGQEGIETAAQLMTGADLGPAGVARTAYYRSAFRDNLARLTGAAEEGAHAHHVFPLKFKDRFWAAGLDVNDPRYGAWWSALDHLRNARGYNESWQAFFRDNPEASPDDILRFGQQLASQYGIKINYQ